MTGIQDMAALAAAISPAIGQASPAGAAAVATEVRTTTPSPTRHRSVRIDGIEVFYREAGPERAPAILLLHGFPTSSHMFRNLIPALADRYRLIAPDYPGFGQSETPDAAEFGYTFEHLAGIVERFTDTIGLSRYALYLQDYGAPIGLRLAVRHPERVSALIVQNGNAYEEGLGEFWKPLRAYWSERSAAHEETLRGFLTTPVTRWLYTQGVSDPTLVSPDGWTLDQRLLDRPGNQQIQLALFYDYRTNPAQYPEWQAYFRKHQPPTLVVWGKNDPVFAIEGALAFQRDLETVEVHLLDTGHFALEDKAAEIARLIRGFVPRHTIAGDDDGDRLQRP